LNDDLNNDIDSIMKNVYPPLLIYATSLTKNPLEAEDLVQEALYRFLIYYDKLDIDDEINYQGWLCKVIRNYFLDTKRKEKKKKDIDHYLTFLQRQENPNNVLTQFIKKNEYTLLYEKILQLNYPYKDVLIFYYFFDMSLSTIASILDLKTNNVKIILYRSRKMLKEELVNEKL